MKRYVLGLLVIGLLGAGGAAAAYRFVNEQGSPSGAPVKVIIEPGTSGAGIAERLEAKGVIRSALAFRIYLKTSGINADLRAGEYALREDMPFDVLAEALKKGPAKDFVRLTIPEGFNLKQTAARVERDTHISAADFTAAATAATIRPEILPPGIDTLEGFLYPATYFVEEDETAEDLVKRLVGEFTARAEEAGLDTSQQVGRTPYEIVIIASMIEEEAKVDDERPKISAVIHNRLRQSIPLGIDATIQYAVNKYEGQPLTKSDLEIDSPFNSRRFQGLPPTPIASPRLSSIQAALDPADVDFIFYVLTEDCRHHLFTKDSKEFERAKARQPRNC